VREEQKKERDFTVVRSFLANSSRIIASMMSTGKESIVWPIVDRKGLPIRKDGAWPHNTLSGKNDLSEMTYFRATFK
jgi:hypothetical protein